MVVIGTVFVGCYFNHHIVCSFGQSIKVNWAYTRGQREDTSGYISADYVRLELILPVFF